MMTLDRAREIRDGLGLPEGATAQEWFHGYWSAPSVGDLLASQLMEAYAVLHAAEVAKERDAARAEAERLRAAIRSGYEAMWKWYGVCPYCSFPEEDGHRVHDADCPTVTILGMRRGTEGREVTIEPQAAVPPTAPDESCATCEKQGNPLCEVFMAGCPVVATGCNCWRAKETAVPPVEPIMAPLRGIAPDCTGKPSAEDLALQWLHKREERWVREARKEPSVTPTSSASTCGTRYGDPVQQSGMTTAESLARSLVENRAVWQKMADSDKVGGTS